MDSISRFQWERIKPAYLRNVVHPWTHAWIEVTIDNVHKFLWSGFQLFALLRISEFIFTSNQAPALLFQEVSINETHIGFYIKDLKTDQYKRGTKLQISNTLFI